MAHTLTGYLVSGPYPDWLFGAFFKTYYILTALSLLILSAMLGPQESWPGLNNKANTTSLN